VIRGRRNESEETSGSRAPEDVPTAIGRGVGSAARLASVLEDRTVSIHADVEEDRFFTSADGTTTVTNRYDLERAVPEAKKSHFSEIDRYWVNKPYAFVAIFHSDRENEQKYYVVEPHLTPIESDLASFLTEKLRTAIKYTADETVVAGDNASRAGVIERETMGLLSRYGLYSLATESNGVGTLSRLKGLLGRNGDSSDDDSGGDATDTDGDSGTGPDFGSGGSTLSSTSELDGIAARPEPALVAEDGDDLSEYQVEKLLYRLKRDFVGYERIDPIKHDINVEDISCDGYNSPVFVYHS